MLDGIPLMDLSAEALLGVGILLVLIGRLIPRRTHEATVRVKEEENARLWTALTAQQEIAREHAEQSRRTAESLEVIKVAIDAIPRSKPEADR